ncbi:hypothethical protein (plasmid) [Ralstonia solanacearum CMR15]|nr:hypothethical protein [Ralstonia solanacearum CMR15]
MARDRFGSEPAVTQELANDHPKQHALTSASSSPTHPTQRSPASPKPHNDTPH